MVFDPKFGGFPWGKSRFVVVNSYTGGYTVFVMGKMTSIHRNCGYEYPFSDKHK